MCAARYRCRQALRFAWKTIKSKVYDVLIVLGKESECAKAVAAIAPAQHFLKKIFSFQHFSHTLYRLSVTLVIRKSRAFHKKIYASSMSRSNQRLFFFGFLEAVWVVVAKSLSPLFCCCWFWPRQGLLIPSCSLFIFFDRLCTSSIWLDEGVAD